jgi:glycosyltransferase involved in cell wall biosynthesis
MTSVLIPAMNEADRISATVHAACALPGAGEVVVIDDGSTDDTARVAELAGANVVRVQCNRGKGAALTAGMKTATGDILLLLDADLGETAGQASRLLEPVLQGEADLTIATFPRGAARGGGIGMVVRLARWGIRRATGRVMEAPLSGQRAMRREVLDRAIPLPAGFGVEVAMTIAALRAGYRVLEVPTEMSHRVTGRSPRAIVHRARQFTAVLGALLAAWRRRV